MDFIRPVMLSLKKNVLEKTQTYNAFYSIRTLSSIMGQYSGFSMDALLHLFCISIFQYCKILILSINWIHKEQGPKSQDLLLFRVTER